GIRDSSVTGVQTCALPILVRSKLVLRDRPCPGCRSKGLVPVRIGHPAIRLETHCERTIPELGTEADRLALECRGQGLTCRSFAEIGRASCRETGSLSVLAV